MKRLIANTVLGTTFIISGLAGVSVISAALAHAEPPACVNPDGQPCAPEGPGCVNPDNSLPCSTSLPDINSAIRRELQQVLPGLLGR